MMPSTLTSYIRCPLHPANTLSPSDERYVAAASPESDREILEATLSCPQCGPAYSIRDGIAYLLPPDMAQSSAVEMRARDNDAAGYASTKTSYENRVEARFLLGHLRVPDGSTVLDLGAGDGRYTHALAATGAAIVVAADISPRMLMLNRLKAQALPEHIRSKIQYVVADANRLPFADAGTSLVLSAQMLEHLQPEDHLRCLREVRRIASPEGQVRMTIYNLRVTQADMLRALRKPSEAVTLFKGRYPAERRGTRRTGYHGPNQDMFYYSQTDSEFRSLLEQAGFNVNTLTGILNLPGPVEGKSARERLDSFIADHLPVWAVQRGYFLAVSARPRPARA